MGSGWIFRYIQTVVKGLSVGGYSCAHVPTRRWGEKPYCRKERLDAVIVQMGISAHIFGQLELIAFARLYSRKITKVVIKCKE